MAWLMATSAFAATTSSDLTKSFQMKFPEIQIDEVNKTPIPGIYELSFGREVVYTTPDGRYILLGMVDRKEGKDLTAIRKSELNHINFADLPLQNAIKDVRGDGKRVLAIFSDPDCPYCQGLEKELKDLTNVTIYTFEIPIVQSHPGAKTKAVGIWCSDDQVNAWGQALSNPSAKIDYEDIDCPNPIDENLALAQKLKISGTPTLIAKDGRVFPGIMSKIEIEKWLGK